MVTAFSLLQEMQTWVDVPAELLAKAKAAKVNDKNNAAFANLVNDWMDGAYDNDGADCVVNEVEYILNSL